MEMEMEVREGNVNVKEEGWGVEIGDRAGEERRRERENKRTEIGIEGRTEG